MGLTFSKTRLVHPEEAAYDRDDDPELEAGKRRVYRLKVRMRRETLQELIAQAESSHTAIESIILSRCLSGSLPSTQVRSPKDHGRSAGGAIMLETIREEDSID